MTSPRRVPAGHPAALRPALLTLPRPGVAVQPSDSSLPRLGADALVACFAVLFFAGESTFVPGLDWSTAAVLGSHRQRRRRHGAGLCRPDLRRPAARHRRSAAGVRPGPRRRRDPLRHRRSGVPRPRRRRAHPATSAVAPWRDLGGIAARSVSPWRLWPARGRSPRSPASARAAAVRCSRPWRWSCLPDWFSYGWLQTVLVGHRMPPTSAVAGLGLVTAVMVRYALARLDHLTIDPDSRGQGRGAHPRPGHPRAVVPVAGAELLRRADGGRRPGHRALPVAGDDPGVRPRPGDC